MPRSRSRDTLLIGMQMTCARCGQHFCYLCSQKLIAGDPYIHFSTRGQGCYNKLFDDKDILDNEWQPIEGFEMLH